MALKEVYDSLKIMGSDLVMLNNYKQQAVENENFETAKAIKTEIFRLQHECMTIDPHRLFDRMTQNSLMIALMIGIKSLIIKCNK